jgi:hypothetical protein
VGVPLNVLSANERKHTVTCSCCSKLIVGTRWKEKNEDFNLCDICYTQRDGIVDNSKLVPIYLFPSKYSSGFNGDALLTPRNVTSEVDPLESRLTYSSIIGRLPIDMVNKEKKSKIALINNCPATLQKDFHKYLGIFPAFSFPHDADNELWQLTEGCEWKLYDDRGNQRFFLDLNLDLMGSLNQLVNERSYGNLSRFCLLVGFCIPLNVIPKWLKLFATRWEAQLKHEESQHKRTENAEVTELSRRQFFTNQCIPLNFTVKNIPGGAGMKNSTLPGFMSVQFTDLAKKTNCKEFYVHHSYVQDEGWFPSSKLANHENATCFQFLSPLVGKAELNCKFNADFPSTEKFSLIVQPLIGARGCDAETTINYDTFCTAKLVKQYADQIMDEGMSRIHKVSPVVRLSKLPVAAASDISEKGKKLWKSSGHKLGTLHLVDTIKYVLEVASFSDSLRLSDVLRHKIFKTHIHLSTTSEMSTSDLNHVTLTFGVRLLEVAATFPFFSTAGLVGEINPNHFYMVQIQLLAKESVILTKYRQCLRDLNQDFLDTTSIFRNLDQHLSEIGDMTMESRRNFFFPLKQPSFKGGSPKKILHKTITSEKLSGGLSINNLTGIMDEVSAV